MASPRSGSHLTTIRLTYRILPLTRSLSVLRSPSSSQTGALSDARINTTNVQFLPNTPAVPGTALKNSISLSSGFCPLLSLFVGETLFQLTNAILYYSRSIHLITGGEHCLDPFRNRSLSTPTPLYI
ncbi:hypothetical protein SERLA73DRAFT_72952 [Serpula lacrymans var. lacrymans S7.3]|uniref:Uncharacterized protein n=2 Tax=Serpula lacrymans var. lacrymans TaxID=341189 RepID=F8PVT4_SERL3|nr:uncharacterized protein SERLADRAFT_437502 [Serpula lacrymans var. lacrymans S7.9]EGO00218.1 hypothetical protein SERLA73DRAFT_72952 [Serpula lacrymans var. lacrymans S7.3]EGO25772.1 hypothetical protein SERLADRAFT_437502 [Serpula lacrymans var. lacrymans S7.9]